MNEVLPGLLSTDSLPLCASIIPRLTESPKPVPFPSSFVVKKGSKILSICSLAIPGPLSEIVNTTELLVSAWVWMKILPR